jgi:hypothetical protein
MGSGEIFPLSWPPTLHPLPTYAIIFICYIPTVSVNYKSCPLFCFFLLYLLLSAIYTYIYILIVFSGEINTLLYFILPSSYKAAQCTVCVSDQDHRNCLEPAKKNKLTALLAYIAMPCRYIFCFKKITVVQNYEH